MNLCRSSSLRDTFLDFEYGPVESDEHFADSSSLNAVLSFEVVPLESVKDLLSTWFLSDEEGSCKVEVWPWSKLLEEVAMMPLGFRMKGDSVQLVSIFLLAGELAERASS